MTVATARTALLALVLAAVALAGCSGGDATKAGGSGAPVTLRIGTDEFAGKPAGNQIEEFARRVEELSGGKIRVEPVWHAAGDVSDWDQRVARLVVDGKLDLGLIPSRAWDTEGVTSLRALNAPFLITSDELLDEVVSGELAAELLSGLEKAGVEGLALFPEGLRHPFGFEAPLLAPEDYAGQTIRTPTSSTVAAVFEALGATTDDPQQESFSAAVRDGTVAGAESSFVLAPSLPRLGLAVGNVTFFPKANALVVNAGVVATLGEERMEILREAAVATREWVIASGTSEADALEQFCAAGGTVVAASESDLAALELATRPVYADLERDAQTKSLIERIRELKQQIGVSAAAPVTCEGADAGTGTAAAGSGDQSVLNGVWRVNVIYEEGLAAGLPAGLAAEELGVQTIRLQDGHYEWKRLARDGEFVCPGRYEILSDRVVFTDEGECDWTHEATFELVDGEIHWRAPRALEPVDATQQLVVELQHGKPWRRIADVESETAFPEGVYRTELTVEFLVGEGIDEGTAHDVEGIQTLTFEGGHWSHATTRNATNPPICEGSYRSDERRVVVTFDSTVDRCGVEGEVLFSAEWTLADGVLRFTEVRPGQQDTAHFAEVVWGGKPWKKIG